MDRTIWNAMNASILPQIIPRIPRYSLGSRPMLKLTNLSPPGGEHINLSGDDYLWRSSSKIGAGKFRLLRPLQPA